MNKHTEQCAYCGKKTSALKEGMYIKNPEYAYECEYYCDDCVKENKMGEDEFIKDQDAYGNDKFLYIPGVVGMMDDDLRESLHGHPDLNTSQSFYEAYKKAHAEKFDEDFTNLCINN